MNVKRILVLGGGFAGLWSAVGAVRKLDELGYGPDAVEVMLVNRDGYHNIRVRNYEPDLTSVRVPLDDVLGPIGAVCVEGEVASIDLVGQTVTVNTESKPRVLPYDRLVVALGSQLLRPNIPGLAEHAFDVDTYNGAVQLNTHLQSLLDRPESPGRFTVLVVGAGLTGIEVATSTVFVIMPPRAFVALPSRPACPKAACIVSRRRWSAGTVTRNPGSGKPPPAGSG